MGLKMSEKKALTKEISARYRQAERKEKTAILDEFIKTSGYNRKYASRMLKQQELKKRGKATKKKRASNHQGKLVYGPDFVQVLRDIWQFFWYKCGKYLAPFMQETRERVLPTEASSPSARQFYRAIWETPGWDTQ
ncbi:hypothetical protein AGMMS4952_25510 [Spirochaetia bacterium]|nr:hypothetical protein AGMMS4952_25510 [Spirochaetia bacterium]